MEAVKQLGAFWALLNELPPKAAMVPPGVGSVPKPLRALLVEDSRPTPSCSCTP